MTRSVEARKGDHPAPGALTERDVMTTEQHYKSNLRDIFFNLFEMHDTGGTVLGQGPFEAMDEQTAKDALTAFEELCTKEMAATFAEIDRTPLVLEDGEVKMPECITKPIDKFYEGQWNLLELPERLGGYGASPSITWAGFEMLAGASPIVAFYVFGTFMARIVDKLGTDSQKARYVQNMIDRKWGGTMVLTEPDAGSDVGAGRAKAKHIEGDVYEIEGVKRFITSGEWDWPENIVHLVLARTEGAAEGTKGLSLFIVPKIWVNEDGSLGERNGVDCTAIEDKMGIKGSTTCELTFGDSKPARGLLMGENHQGIRQMFMVIEQARMAIGFKSMTTLSTAYLNALEFAKERVQGPDLAKALDKGSPRVRIIEHPDVRRMLMHQKAHAEGLRALCYFATNLQDQVEMAGGHGAEESKQLDRLNDLMLPMVKGYSAHRVYEVLSDSLQIYGGSGYLKDYPIEQYIRDQKIDSLYEGTTQIQALDLFFRKIARDGGETLMGLTAQVMKTLEEKKGGDAMALDYAAVERAMGDLQAILGVMMQKVPESVYHVGLHGNRILYALSEGILGWLWLRQAELAQAKLKEGGLSDDDQAFYTGKVAACRYWSKEVLPNVTLHRKVIEKTDLDLMDVPEEAF
jgi:alkylation response protein AidB-like acyl-CoA dehydrogenase